MKHHIVSTATALLLSANLALADTGVVVKEEVCGSDNIIIETTDGWYIAAEWYGGPVLFEGMSVYGEMKTYGMRDLCDDSGSCGPYWIEDYEYSFASAMEEHCD